jgi:organic radical activating enzyme
MRISHIGNDDDVIDLFIDITTKCNLNCSYCFARHFKEWEQVQSLKNLKYIEKILKFSPYKFNIIFFGGEALLHPEINEIKDLFLNSEKTNKVILLSNGLLDSEFYKDDRINYCLTLHNYIKEEQFNIFLNNCSHVKNLLVNLMLEKSEKFLNRYEKLKQYKLDFSQIYNHQTIVENIVLPEIDYQDDDYIIGEETFNYKDFFLKHKEINVDDIEYCFVKELNIDIRGNISNDCLNTNINIFDNPLFFKSYNNRYKCSHGTCKDCNGTIRTTKILKD